MSAAGSVVRLRAAMRKEPLPDGVAEDIGALFDHSAALECALSILDGSHQSAFRNLPPNAMIEVGAVRGSSKGRQP